MRQTTTFNYWYDVALGGLISAVIMILSGSIILDTVGLNSWTGLYSFLCIFVVVFFQWYDDNYKCIRTNLSKNDNLSLIIKCFDELNWKYEQKSNTPNLTLNKYLLKFLAPTIIPVENKILFNFKYQSTTQTGRLPFIFGISFYNEWKFKRTVKKFLSQSKYSV